MTIQNTYVFLVCSVPGGSVWKNLRKDAQTDQIVYLVVIITDILIQSYYQSHFSLLLMIVDNGSTAEPFNVDDQSPGTWKKMV